MANEFTAAFNGGTLSKETIKLAAPPTPRPEKKSARAFHWNFVFGGLILLAFLFTAYRYWIAPPAQSSQTVGRVAFSDFNTALDKATISLTGLPAPQSGSHYEAWLLSQGGETRIGIGAIEMGSNGQGQLIFINANQRNILAGFDQVEITLEPDNDPAPDESSGEIVASSVFPPLALAHVRHVIVQFDSAPEHIALMQGLRKSASDLNTNAGELRAAFTANDEKLLRRKTEEIINQLVGSENPARYKDWNGDGALDDPSDGYGLLSNGDPGYNEQGYIAQVAAHTEFAAQSMDATANIQLHAAHVEICADNMDGWSKQLLEQALQVQDMPFGAEMEPLIAKLSALADQILS
ncbi:MAG: anti-sigma factor, partial [Anaerolineales bacterium]|nr:anti-sigma factor [Anaerolineales bacterium]